MRIYDLFETSYHDVLPPELVSYIETVTPKKWECIHFTNSKSVAYSDSIELSDDTAMRLIPVSYYKDNPMVVDNVEQFEYFRIVIPSGNILQIGNVNHSQCITILTTLGVKDPTTEIKRIMEEFSYPFKKRIYGFISNLAIKNKITNGSISDTTVTPKEYANKLSSLGFDGIMDDARSISEAIVSREVPNVVFILRSADLRLVASYNMHASNGDTEEATVDELAAMVAEALHTSLNTDDPYYIGLHHYYWTFDGMQIRITETFKGNNNKNDGTAYLIDIETPYGTLYHSSSPGDTFDKVKDDISARYKTMNEPLSSWRPSDRDKFLIQMGLDYKDEEQRIHDLIKEVNKYYPSMREFGMRHKITIKPLEQYSDFDRTFLSGIMETFSSQGSAREFIMHVTNDEEDISMDNIKTYFPRSKLPKKMTFDELKKIALIYDIAKNLQPKKSGWRLFYGIK